MAPDLPLPLVVILVNLVLLAAGLLIFYPEGLDRPRKRDLKRLEEKYGRYVLASVVVLAAHLFLVQLDGQITRWLGWDFAPFVSALEGGLVPSVEALWNPFLDYFFGVAYFVVHPFMLYFAPLLFLLSEDERAAKAALLLYPLAYAMALPFYLFFPSTNVFTFHGLSSPVAELFPQLWGYYYNLTTVNNTFPSLHVAIAILLANATRYSRNVRFRYFAFFYAATVVLATIYLAIHWVTDVVGGILVAAFTATLTSRILSVERLALQRVKPDPEGAQAVVTAATELVDAVKQRAEELGYVDAKPTLVGSVAKDTYLAHKVDFDCFVLYPITVTREELERRGLTLGRLVLPDGDEKYAEHPYVHGRWKGWPADIVPAYEVEDPSKKMSAVDRTPFHTRFVLERMSREQRDQTRLLKQFMLGVGVYGAEARTRGFSGYLCELLVLKYGSFRGAVRAGARWKPGTFLSLETVEGNPKFTDPLVFLDPVDPKRNVASAVSAETLSAYTEACKAFLHREGLSFFFPRQLLPLAPDDLERIVRRRRGEFLLVRFTRPDVLEDHLYDQLRKADAAIRNLLERHEFEVKRVTSDVRKEEVRILVEIARLRLPEGVVHSGPPVKEGEHAERFRKAWTGTPEALSEVYEEEGRLKVKRRREFRRAEDLVRAKLATVDLGKHVNQAVRVGFAVESSQDIVREDTAMVLTRHFNRAKPWEV